MLRHQECIALQMRRFSLNVQVIEELTQTVFIKAYMGIDKYKPEAPFLHWLRTIASRTGYEHWRSKYKNEKHVLFEEESHGAVVDPGVTDDEPWKKNATSVLAHVMSQLKPDDRQALYMIYIDGMNVAEAADCMGWNLSMTKMRAFRAKRKLRKILQAEGIGPGWMDTGKQCEEKIS